MNNGIVEKQPGVLRSDSLIKKYKNRTVVNEVTIQVRQGEIVGLLGPNGAGKTTTFYMIVGMVRPNGGRVFVDENEITSLPMYQRARLGIGYLPQEASVFRRLTVRENLLAVLEMSDLPRKEREEKCDRLLEDFGLTHLVKSKGYVLSGGERRRTEIARALALDPKFMLLDEPFAGIDPIAVEEIMKIVTKLKEKNIGGARDRSQRSRNAVDHGSLLSLVRRKDPEIRNCGVSGKRSGSPQAVSRGKVQT